MVRHVYNRISNAEYEILEAQKGQSKTAGREAVCWPCWLFVLGGLEGKGSKECLNLRVFPVSL